MEWKEQNELLKSPNTPPPLQPQKFHGSIPNAYYFTSLIALEYLFLIVVITNFCMT